MNYRAVYVTEYVEQNIVRLEQNLYMQCLGEQINFFLLS